MKTINIKEAIGLPIGHDITQIIPGEFKGVAFKRGHIIEEKDIDKLKSLGKEHIYIEDIPDEFIHEDDCAVRIAKAICNNSDYDISGVSEGKINIYSKIDGVFRVNEKRLYELNEIEHITIATIVNNAVVSEGQKIISERIVPLYTKRENIEKLERLCSYEEIFKVIPFVKQNIYLIITGTEIFNGTIKDKFYDTLRPKFEYYGCNIIKTVKLPDDKQRIKEEIRKAINMGVDMVVCTGGMSVDEDDLTPIAIKEEIEELIVHGVPVQPGNMFLLGYENHIPVMGIPTAAIFNDKTVFDMVLPLIVCKEKLNRDFFLKLAVGGLL
ncbi:molybdopterin biosynthesis enzyme [Clostridium pasteurianum DSM 525 = ATCC 6013]|uniref:Molybdopterin molybdenumtransferase n=1 Tax=Clostridium pasteurianum DSM 525 = ATCC 6013 TaxID=1262449 RepID=A0A0H3J113_CLOPA|nr:molybdopterin-binding protein [Clostridium pasteurianum]AJA46382.1 molybdopterin biosynthesis enzyme [Clostridium pasteurianum DSM 525 = ATCC 6013]AJA50370.1 molybdopterin biosynthesis enzyme [Clostridium pasteurianum DSM 525 = ATCC 6013]AOZ73819.1 molybdopterin biosynthesis protein [Clostridium pasteurianum DSM 525 = ATCC 6013]AOZ77616.1 molybdopterin biosynthesis protein [Clostridium pasteurianum]ELP60957.1 Molybdopterin biosynthesis enzyme [Clostridium pasteurianum DSM 525 = ATCC 6013]